MFWLKVKKEYILENFEDLFAYLRDFPYDDEKSNERSDFLSTIQCMEELCDNIGERLAGLPSYRPLPDDMDIPMTARLMGLTLLAEYRSGRDTATVMTALANLIPFVSRYISVDALARLQGVVIAEMYGRKISHLKFTWRNLEREVFNLPFFINRISETIYHKTPADAEIVGYEGKGCLLLLPDGELRLYPEMNLARCRETATGLQAHINGKIKVYVSPKNADSPKNFQERYRLYNLIIDTQKQVQPSPRKVLRTYADGDIVKVKVTQIIPGYPLPKVMVESVDPDYETVRGMLIVRTNDKCRPKAQDILNRMKANEDIFITTYHTTERENRFEVSEGFELAYRLVACESVDKSATAIFDGTYPKGYQLLTEDGVRVGVEYSILDKLDAESTQEFIRVLKSGSPVRVKFYNGYPPLKNDKFFMYCTPDEEPFDAATFSRRDADCAMIDACLEEMFIAATDNSGQKHGEKIGRILSDARPVIAIARLLWRETATASPSPSKRLTLLSVVAMLCRLGGQEKDVNAVTVERRYLSKLVAFAGNTEVHPLTISDAELAEIPHASAYKNVVDALTSYKSLDSGMSNRSTGTDPSLIAERVRSLVKASNEIVDIVGTVELNNIKREIARAMDVEEEYVPIFSERTHYGMENMTQEFKTSIVFAPLDRQRSANHDYQKWAILKTVCGFLNSRAGGKLILGVNDGGYAVGVANDIAELFSKRVISEPTLDRYRTYVQNLIDYTFADYMSPNVPPTDITVLNVSYEEEVNDEGKELLHIHVKPYPYGVVKFRQELTRPDDYSESYVRRSGSTMPLTSRLKEEIMAYKTSAGSSLNIKIVSLRTALADRKTVILKDYASSSGVRDRKIEPYAVWPRQGMVYGYDHESRKGRLFKVSRCSRVEILPTGWSDYRCSPNVNLDPFGFLIEDSKAISVRLLLTSYAAQLLREEHPDAPVTPNTSVSRNRFPFEMNCKVSVLDGITRFCLGLPGETEVAKGTGLTEYISSKAQALTGL